MNIYELINLNNLILCLACVALTKLIKTVLRNSNPVYRARILPVLSILIGGVMGYFTGAGLMVGLAIVFVSTLVFRAVKEKIVRSGKE